MSSTRNKTIPKFNSVKEEAEFWGTHDFTGYLLLSKPAEMVYEPKNVGSGEVERT